MANDNKTPTEAGSDACSDLSNCKNESSDASQGLSADLSEQASSSGQNQSSSASENEECLAKEVCLKKSNPKSSSYSGSSEEQSPSCSENSVCRSSKVCLRSKRGASDPMSGSECTESNATRSSTEAVSSEEESNNKKVANSKKKNDFQVKSKENAKAEDDKSGWSLSEDALLRSMKEANDGLSWEDIGKSLNRGKNECKSRWKVIKNQPLQDTPSEEKSKETVEQEKQVPAEAETATKDNNCKTPARADGYGVVDDTVDALSRGFLEELTEHDRQRQYWQEHIGRHLYPASIRVAPDAHFSQSDCLVLEMIDARYQSLRWQEAQARFYNETGRMVPLEVIRRKCEDAAVRTEADIAGWLASIPN